MIFTTGGLFMEVVYMVDFIEIHYISRWTKLLFPETRASLSVQWDNGYDNLRSEVTRWQPVQSILLL